MVWPRRRVPNLMTGPAPDPADARNERFATYVVPEIEVLLRVARTITPDYADAEDLVQDRLVRAFRAIDRFDGAHPRAWLLTILRNTQINRSRRQRPELLADPERALSDTTGGDESVEALVVGATFDAVVEDAVRNLPDRFRRAVELVDVDGLRYAEAAQVLGVPVGTVMSRLHRARRRIRDRLATAGLAPRSPR
jgi:RNA polymerase sigma-70 factor, ECF subfamily